MARLSRRDFLKTSGVAAATAPLAAVAAAEASGPITVEGATPVTVMVNGSARRLEVLPDTSLVSALREGCGLTGTKQGCGHGACGACTVHVDGVPVASCLHTALDADGRRVTTVEGLAPSDGVLHPVQQAFVEADALQCGYCTPGMVMSGAAFFDAYRAAGRKDEPTLEEVAHAMAGNVCRCGAQPAILEAVRAACTGRRARIAVAPGGAVEGLPRNDAVPKVTGRARYTVDQYPPGVLHAVFLRSPHAHARLTKLDLAPARAMPGVRAVLQVIPRVGAGFARIRFAGQELAAVAADTLAHARAAAAAITAEYEVLPHVVDAAEAEKPDAPLVFEPADRADVPKASEGLPLPRQVFSFDGNVRGPEFFPLYRADGGAAFHAARAADVAVQLDVETSVQMHMALEPHCAVARWEGDRLTLWTSTQTVQGVQDDLAEALDIPASRVKVLAEFVGGGFGAKAGLKPEQVVAAQLAREAGAPVRLVLGVKEELVVAGNRPSTRQRIWVGAEKNGRLTAVHHEGKTACGIGVGEKATGMTSSRYSWDHVHQWDVNVLTNTACATPFRAPGHPAGAFALEQAVDAVAARMGVDPLLLRLNNEQDSRRAAVLRLAHEKWSDHASLRRVAADKGRFARGVGVATADWFVLLSPTCRVEVQAWRDGHVEVRTATQDMGQGSKSVLQNMAHRALGLPAERIDVRVADSSLPTAPGSFGSITTSSIGPAARDAFAQLKEELLDAAEGKLGSLTAEERGARDARGNLHAWGALMAHLPSTSVTVTGRRTVDKGGYKILPGPLHRLPLPIAIGQDTVSSVMVAEVEVDRLLGRTRVLRMMTAIDAGLLMSPVTAYSQVMGGMIQGISYGLYEGRRMDRRTGRQLNRSLETYALLGMADAPAMEVHFLPRPTLHTPHGGAGLGENATIAAAAAVANAFFHATGVRALRTPMTPASVLPLWM